MIPGRYFGPVLACLVAAPAIAADGQRYDVPAQSLDRALIAFGEQAHLSIGGVDARMGGVRSKALRGRMSVDRALRILLRDTGFGFVRIDATTVRIVRAAPVRRPDPPAPRPVAAPLPPEPIAPEIVVTATKQPQDLDHYPGTAHIESVGSAGLSEIQGTAAFVGRLPSLASTNLGPGRNKIFVRGIADSSFTGPTQSTIGLYLGDMRLTYNAPEPDLRLYDVDRIEVIEGPQGTLYGAGTLGGIVRIVPNTPDPSGYHGSASIDSALTRGGAAGLDLGGTLNIPLLSDRAALRIVGYRQIEGGYIDNATLGTRNTNRSRILGGRASLLVRPGNDWSVELSGVTQNIDTHDGQYADVGLPPYTHAANIAQPHDNDFKGANLEIRKSWGKLALVSSTGMVNHDLSETFDATGYLGLPGVQAFESSDAIRLISHETRLSSSGANGRSWVAGINIVYNRDRIDRMIGPVGDAVQLAAIRNVNTEVALFGEATQPLVGNLSATLGARLVYAATVGELLGGADSSFEPHRHQKRILPTAALSWRPRRDTMVFARFQTGFRSGGIAIDPTRTDTANRFASDEIYTGEIGLRFGGLDGEDGRSLSGALTGFLSRWNSIQADLIGPTGLPYTDNIGSGTVYGIEASLVWKPVRGLSLDGAMFLNRSALSNPAQGFEDANERALPNIAKAGGRMTLAWETPVSAHYAIKFDGSLRYAGTSHLGTSAPFLLDQGELIQAEASAQLASDRWALTFDVTNLFNRSGNSFAFGNPFTVAQGQQRTPLRPRTAWLGLRFKF